MIQRGILSCQHIDLEYFLWKINTCDQHNNMGIKTVSGQLQVHVRKHVLAILTTYMKARLYTDNNSGESISFYSKRDQISDTWFWFTFGWEYFVSLIFLFTSQVHSDAWVVGYLICMYRKLSSLNFNIFSITNWNETLQVAVFR